MRSALGRFDHPAYVTAAATAVSYLVVLFLLFVIPYVLW